MDKELGRRLLRIRQQILDSFDASHWEEVGLATGHSEILDSHPRLYRSLYWGDEDYSANVVSVLRSIAESDPAAITTIEEFIKDRFGHAGSSEVYISAKPAERRITFSPYVFSVPDHDIQSDLVAVMMPFKAEFNPVYNTIKSACNILNLRCLRVDDFWDEPTIVQDIFNLIFRSTVVVVDYTGLNPNVMYETGIAHTLGKHVIPISQSIDNVPFDTRHHRVLKYLLNDEGLERLSKSLQSVLEQFRPKDSAGDWLA